MRRRRRGWSCSQLVVHLLMVVVTPATTLVRVSSIGHLEKVGEGLSVQPPGVEQAAERMGEGRTVGQDLLPWALRSRMFGL